LQPEVRDYEPRLALDGGGDGLDLVRRLIGQVVERELLATRAGLFLEIGIGQADVVAELLRAAGLVDVAMRSDYARIPRIVAGFAPG
jgi:release factor glutamine methyltransferase